MSLHLHPPMPDLSIVPSRWTMIPTPNRSRGRRFGMLGDVSPWLYSAPPGMVTYTKTPYVTSTDPQTGETVTTGGAVIYPNAAPSSVSPSYQAPALIPAPACTQAAGGAFVSADCVDKALAVEAQNLQLINDANRRVFVQNCLNAGNGPTDCNSRTYGQTPAGGFTSDAFTQGGQYLENSAGAFVGAEPPITSLNTPQTTLIPPLNTLSKSPAQSTADRLAQSSKSASGGGTSTKDSGSDNSALYWIAGLAAAAILVVAVSK